MKKIILFTTFAGYVLFGFSQSSTSYLVTVTIKHSTQKGKAYLRYFTSNGRYLDSASLIKGRCSFAGSLPQNMLFAKLYFLFENEKEPINENATEILLEPANIKVMVDDKLFTAKFGGTVLQEQFSELQQSLVDIRKKQFILNQEIRKAESENNAAEKDKLLAVNFPGLFLEKQKILALFFQKHPSSPISGAKFEEFAGDENPDPAIVEPVFNMLNDNIKKMPAVEGVMKRVAISKKTAVGMKALDFTQADSSGNNISLSTYAGKYVLVDFWAGWCMPCRAENPLLVKLHNEYGPKGFSIISVSLDGERAAWTKAIIKDKMVWTNVSDLKIFDNEIAQLYGIASIPQNILIAPDGKIVAKNLRGAALEEKLADLMK